MEFCKFPELSLEIRLIVWGIALFPRVVQVTYQYSKTPAAYDPTIYVDEVRNEGR
jgi:2EXR family